MKSLFNYFLIVLVAATLFGLLIETLAEDSPNHTRAKRLLSQPNKSYQECKTPNGGNGHCKHVQHCALSVFRQNFLRFLDYFCIIEQSAIGVCCPDEISEKAGPSIASLPQRADTDDSLPVWDIVSGETNNQENDDQTVARPEERGCGLSTKSQTKITGGRPSDPGQWPWMAALLRRGPSHAYCGGVLITDRHVLTAAHCTSKFRANEITVRLGEYNFQTYNETRARDFRVQEIRQHVDYDPDNYENDIAVLKLQQPAMFNSYVWPVCMPPPDETWEGYMAIVTGWGSQFFGGPDSDVLMEVSIPIWTKENCKGAFIERITDSVVCAGAKEGGRDSCQGDSGGPLLVQLPNKRWVTVGIVSWGIRCGEKNHPGIYTRVSAFTQWIVDNAVF